MPRAQAVTREDLVKAVETANEVVNEAMSPVEVDTFIRAIAFGFVLRELLEYEYVDEDNDE